MRKEEFDDWVDAAAEFATAVAGDDPAAHAELVVAAVNLAAAAREDDAPPGADVIARTVSARRLARGTLRTPAAAGASPAGPTIYQDPILQENLRRLVRNRRRVRGGVETTDFPDCVAVGDDAGWGCSGTLVAPRIVLTAAHCKRGGSWRRVFVGDDVERPQDGRVVGVREATMHPAYDPPGSHTHDLMVLVLDEPVDGVAARVLAEPEALEGRDAVRLVGYGHTDEAGTTGYGRRRMVDVALATPSPDYGAEPESEFVAAEPLLDRDSCKGDSGGPAYAEHDGTWVLAGTTSRPTQNARRKCGDGGIYTRVAQHADWIRRTAGSDWPS